MQELKNKIITIEDVIKIGEILNNRHLALQMENDQSVQENEGRDYDQQFYRLSTTYNNLEFSILYDGDHREKREDFNWFKETLRQNVKSICGIGIAYTCSFTRNSKNRFSENDHKENIRFSIDGGYSKTFCNFDKTIENNEEFKAISNQIEEIIQNMPPRFDKTLKNRSLYRLTPSFAISFGLSAILALILFLTTKFNILPSNILTYLTNNSWIIFGGCAVLALVLGFVLPNPNMALFKQIYIDKQYSSYDTDWQVEHYKNDYDRFKDQVEFSVGKFYGSDIARKKIQRNFKISLGIISVSIILLVILAVVVMI